MSYQTNQMTTPSPVKIITSPITSHDYMPLSHDRGAVNINPQERDCHFYFYSTCSKGDGCKFRHASVALGSEVTCDLWRDSVCQRKICAFRHCTFDRQRSIIPCYWEGQPVGCQKHHCPFMHFKPRPPLQGVRERISEYKLSSIKVKNLKELQREKAHKKEGEGTMEKTKEEVEGGMEDTKKERKVRMEGLKKDGEGRLEERKKEKEAHNVLELVKGLKSTGAGDCDVTLHDMRQELVKRMLAEKKAFEGQHKREQDAIATRILTSVARKTKGHVIPVAKRRVMGGAKDHQIQKVDVPLKHKGSLPHHSHGDMTKPHRNHSDTPHRNHGNLTLVTLNRKLKENSDNGNSKGVALSHDEAIPNKVGLLSHDEAIPNKLIRTVKATPSPLDFKVKTLEELRAERLSEKGNEISLSESTTTGTDLERRGARVTKEIEMRDIRVTKETEGKGARVTKKTEGRGAHVTKESKVEGAGVPTEPEKRGKEEANEVEGAGVPKKKRIITIVRRKTSTTSNSDPTTSNSAPTTTNPTIGTESKLGQSTLSSLKRSLGSSGSEWSRIKRRKGNKTVEEKEWPPLMKGARKGGMARIARVQGADTGDKGEEPVTSLSELKNEIMLDLELPPSEDDVLLLEEMATYDEDDDVTGGRSNTDLSESRNDDDLILQMEEFL